MRSNRWLVVGVLTLAYALTYFDRQLLTLLVEPVRRSLHLNDGQIGFLQGFAFAVSFALGGVPLGWLIDNRNRIRVAGGCILVWSCATSATGLASSFLQLFSARAATAFAEAGCSPAAVSLFSDLVPPRLLSRITSVYMVAPTVGGGLSLLSSGYALRHFERTGGLTLPLVGRLMPWQSVFVVLGAPGVLLAVLAWALLHEPLRSGAAAASASPITLRLTLRYIYRDSYYLFSYFCAYAGILAAFTSLLAWFPTVAIRSGFGSPAAVGRELGLVFMGCGIAGAFSAQAFVGRVSDEEVVSRTLRIAGWFAGALILPSFLLAIVPAARVSIACYAVLLFAISVLTTLMPLPLQIGTPNRMRGRMVGLFLLCVNVVGSGLGPLAGGKLSDAFGRSARMLALALGCILVVSTTTGFYFLLRSRNQQRRARLVNQPTMAT